MPSIFQASGQHLLYSMVLLGREECILWILRGETLYIQRGKHVSLEKFLWTEINKSDYVEKIKSSCIFHELKRF